MKCFLKLPCNLKKYFVILTEGKNESALERSALHSQRYSFGARAADRPVADFCFKKNILHTKKYLQKFFNKDFFQKIFYKNKIKSFPQFFYKKFLIYFLCEIIKLGIQS